MVEVVDKKFFGGTVDMDDKRFIACQFFGCTLKYRGREWSWDNMTSFDDRCFWQFEGCALRTINLLYFLGVVTKPLAAGQS